MRTAETYDTELLDVFEQITTHDAVDGAAFTAVFDTIECMDCGSVIDEGRHGGGRACRGTCASVEELTLSR